jgi:hypothetical protein
MKIDRIVNIYCGLCPYFREYIGFSYLGYCEHYRKEIDLKLLIARCDKRKELTNNE